MTLTKAKKIVAAMQVVPGYKEDVSRFSDLEKRAILKITLEWKMGRMSESEYRSILGIEE